MGRRETQRAASGSFLPTAAAYSFQAQAICASSWRGVADGSLGKTIGQLGIWYTTAITLPVSSAMMPASSRYSSSASTPEGHSFLLQLPVRRTSEVLVMRIFDGTATATWCHQTFVPLPLK
jgi:hypothetical protein